MGNIIVGMETVVNGAIADARENLSGDYPSIIAAESALKRAKKAQRALDIIRQLADGETPVVNGPPQRNGVYKPH